MKVVLLLSVFITVNSWSQEIKVTGMKQAGGKNKTQYVLSGVSPDGNNLLVSGLGYKGLSLLNIQSGIIKVITDKPGAGYEPRFSGDGSHLYFRSDDFSGLKRLSSVTDYEISSGNTTELITKGRDVTPPIVSAGKIHFTSDGNLETKNAGFEILKSSGSDIFVLLQDLTPVLYINGERKVLKPNGEGPYIWVSLSPDKTKLLYCFKGLETYISDLDGKVLYSIGRLHAAKWLNNNIIIGMDDKDDGNVVTGSEIVSFSLASRERKVLTSSATRHEMYPFPFPDGKRLACQTPDGKIFIMKLRIK